MLTNSSIFIWVAFTDAGHFFDSLAVKVVLHSVYWILQCNCTKSQVPTQRQERYMNLVHVYEILTATQMYPKLCDILSVAFLRVFFFLGALKARTLEVVPHVWTCSGQWVWFDFLLLICVIQVLSSSIFLILYDHLSKKGPNATAYLTKEDISPPT